MTNSLDSIYWSQRETQVKQNFFFSLLAFFLCICKYVQNVFADIISKADSTDITFLQKTIHYLLYCGLRVVKLLFVAYGSI